MASGEAAPLLPKEFVAALLGTEDPDEVKLTGAVVEALAKIDPELAPRLFDHPLADFIVKGVDAFDELIAAFGEASDEMERAAFIDAVAEIIDRQHATGRALEFLQKVLGETEESRVASLAARGIALAREPGFLEQQRNFLASESPSEIRLSARLLGWGRYEPAVDLLLAHIHTDNMAVADAVIWALGEIRSPAALPKLHRMLSDAIRTEDVLDAVGQIGDSTSVPRILPYLRDGSASQQRRAARALARVARKSGPDLDPALRETARAAAEGVVDHTEDPFVGFYAILSVSLLGGYLDPQRILKALGGKLSDDDMSPMQALFAHKTPAE
jgi:hypothetical protein